MKTENSIIKRLVSPWEDNPSKPENFYGSSIKEEIDNVEEEDINEEAEASEEPVSQIDKFIESADPYYLILKDLK
jgi:hypothetical protein